MKKSEKNNKFEFEILNKSRTEKSMTKPAVCHFNVL